MSTGRRLPHSNGAAILVASLGVLFPVSYLVYVVGNDAYLRGPTWLFPLGLIFVLVLAGTLLYGGYWLATCGFSPEQCWRVSIWALAGVIATLAITFWPIFYQRIVGVTIADPLFILIVSAGLGANAGVVAGVAQVQSERQFARVQRARDSLEFLNRLLRHNVLNTLQIIQGNAELLIDRTGSDTAAAERARTIHKQAGRTNDLIQNTKVLIQQIEGNVDREEVDLSAVVAEELEAVGKIYPEADIETDIARDVRVRADDLVSAIVDNLVQNAITHNDRDPPRVDVTLETRDGVAVLEIADDGPGIPDEELDAIDDPGTHGDNGLGLYLVDTLVDQYDGTIRFDENEPRGTVVTAELPRWDGRDAD